jgi:large subunit ribosomal protein L29
MLKATDLRERTAEDLRELEKTLTRDVFQNRFKNFTNRLDDTSSIKKAKKDLARVKTILTERVKGLTPVAKAPAAAPAEPTTTDDAPKAKAAAKKTAAAATKAAAKSAEGVPTAKKSAGTAKTTLGSPQGGKTAKKSEAK